MKVISIGRGEDCNIVFPDSTIRRRHAILKIYATGKMEIVDMGQNGTFVNGVKLSPNTPYPVTRKDVVSFAHVRQLDWSQIPDELKYFRYIVIACVAVILIVGGSILASRFLTESEPKAPVQPELEQDIENVAPQEGKSEDAVQEENGESTERSDEKKEIPSDFFKQKKRNVKKKQESEKKEPEKKEETKPQPQDEKKNNKRIIM